MLCLKRATDPGWATAALRDVNGVLVDHAHCEMKAAANALSLAARHSSSLGLVRSLTELAREELVHFERVLEMLEARGVALGPPSIDSYAAQLRRALSTLPKSPCRGLVDRLLGCALIEARSCERFKLLGEATAKAGTEPALGALWTELLASEAQHYRTFVEWAVRFGEGKRDQVIARLDSLADIEADIVSNLARRPAHERATIHG